MAHKKICELHLNFFMVDRSENGRVFIEKNYRWLMIDVSIFFFLHSILRYVIKAVVYEIGILTEADENATEADENVT